LKLLKQILKYTVFIAIAVFLLYLAFRGTKFDELKENLAQANYTWVVISIVMGYAAIISRGYRWLLLLEPMGYKPRFWSSVHAVGFGYMFNIFVPRGGELGRCGIMNRSEKIPVDKLFGTVILERVIDFAFLIIVITLAFILNIDNFQQMLSTELEVSQVVETKTSFDLMIDSVLNVLKYILIGGFALGFLAAIIALLFFRNRITNHPKFNKVREFWDGLKAGFISIKNLNNKWQFIGHSVFIWLMYFLMVYICFFSLNETSNLTVADGFLVMAAASLGIVIPAPGGMGSYHYLVTLALVVIGIERSIGFSFATIVHTSQTIMLLSSGLIGLLYFSLTKKKDQATKSAE
jgi:uncharacterized protein (TIRG00374 family)